MRVIVTLRCVSELVGLFSVCLVLFLAKNDRRCEIVQIALSNVIAGPSSARWALRTESF